MKRTMGDCGAESFMIRENVCYQNDYVADKIDDIIHQLGRERKKAARKKDSCCFYCTEKTYYDDHQDIKVTPRFEENNEMIFLCLA